MGMDAYGEWQASFGNMQSAISNMPLLEFALTQHSPDFSMLRVPLEAYTNLYQVWPVSLLHKRLRELVELFLDKILNHSTHHSRLFFDHDWTPKGETISYGHDIEASWLLVRAAQTLDQATLLQRTGGTAVQMAQAVFASGLDQDGSMFNEGKAGGVHDFDKHWWVQAEAMVGFYTAYQFSGEAHFARAAVGCWNFIERHMLDHQHGDWFKITSREGKPYLNHHKVGPWECPYHHARACLEMIKRLE